MRNPRITSRLVAALVALPAPLFLPTSVAQEQAQAQEQLQDQAQAQGSAPIEVVGPGPEDSWQLAVESSKLERFFYVVETAGRPLTGVRVETRNLTAGSETPVALTVEPAGFDLAPFEEKEIRLTATLPAVATYVSRVRLRWPADPAAAPLDHTLTVERRKTQDSVSLETPERLQRTAWWGRTRIRFELQEPDGHSLDVFPPRLTKLQRTVTAGGEAVDVMPPEARVSPCSPPPPRSGEAALGAGPAAVGGGETAVLTLKGFEQRCLELDLGRLGATGTYTATLAVATADGDETSEDVILLVRHPWLMAALVIFFGVWLSSSTRRWWGVDRPRLLAERQIVELRGEMRTALAQDDPMLKLLEQEADSLLADLRLGVMADIDEGLKTLETRLHEARGLRRVLAVEVSRVVWNPDRRQEIGQELAALRREIARPDLLGRLGDLHQRAEKLEEAIAEGNREFLDQQALPALEAAVETLREWLDGASQPGAAPTLPPAEIDSLRSRLEATAEDVGAARAALAEGSLPGAREAYLRARDGQAQAALERLRLTLEHQPMPLGYASEAQWKADCEPWLERLEAARDKGAETLVEETEKVRLESLGKLMSTLRQALRAALPREPSLQAQIDELDAALAQLHEAPAAAETAYREGVAAYENLAVAHVFSKGPTRGLDAASAADGEAAQLPEQTEPTPAPGALLPGRLPSLSLADLVRKVRQRDRWALAVAIVAAVAVGLKALWLAKPTWGGLGDYIEAFLWGFGLHQVTTFAEVAGPLRLSRAAEGQGAGGVEKPPENEGE